MILVINLGMKSVRSVLYNKNGEQINFAALPVNTYLSEDRVVQKPSEWIDKSKQTINTVLGDFRDVEISYITITASSSCLICLDKTGDCLDDCYMVSDKREVKLPFNAPMLSKILWVKENRTDIYEKTAFFLSPNDYFIYKLTGKIVTDEMNFTKYGADFFEQYGIQKQNIPAKKNVGCVVGNVNEAWGINTNAKVILTSYDAICNFYGSGLLEYGDTCDVSGTVTVVRTLWKKRVGSDKLFSIPHINGNAYLVGGSNNLGGGVIEWAKQVLYNGESSPYEKMEIEARSSDIGANGVLFLPYLLAERMPLYNNDLSALFFGLERKHRRADMIMAVFESAGFLLRDMTDSISNAENAIRLSKIRASGGMTKIPFISQLKSDICGIDVEVLSNIESTAMGAAVIVAHTQQHYTLKESYEKFISVRSIIKPDKKAFSVYSDIFELYKEIRDSLIHKGIYRKQKQLYSNIYHNKTVKVDNL